MLLLKAAPPTPWVLPNPLGVFFPLERLSKSLLVVWFTLHVTRWQAAFWFFLMGSDQLPAPLFLVSFWEPEGLRSCCDGEELLVYSPHFCLLVGFSVSILLYSSAPQPFDVTFLL